MHHQHLLMAKAFLIHDTINERLCEDDSLPLCEHLFPHSLLENKVRIMFIQQSPTPTLLASPPLRFPSLTLTHLALWAAPAVRSAQRRIRWRCDEQTPNVGDTHSDAHNEANARVPTPREGNYFCSSSGFIFCLSLVRNSAQQPFSAPHRRWMSVRPRDDYTTLLSDDISCIFCHPNPISCWVRLRSFAAATRFTPLKM